MRIAVCEDDAIEREQFLNALRRCAPTRNAELFSNGSSLLQAAAKKPPFHILFLDIGLPGERGMEVARELRRVSPSTGIVFVTVTGEYAVEAYSLRALHYLMKPVTAEGIRESFRRLALQNARPRSLLTLAVGRDRHTFYQDEIVCLQSASHAVEVSLADGRTLKVWAPLSELEQRLDGRFLKINRGTLVNMGYVKQLGLRTCVLRDGVRLTVSGRESAGARTAYQDFLLSGLSEEASPGQETERQAES